MKSLEKIEENRKKGEPTLYNKKIKYFVNVALLILFIASCKDAKDPFVIINTKLKLDRENDFKKDLPRVYNDSNVYWPFIRKRRNIIRLPDIENGSDKFQIRIWQETGKGELVLLIIHEDNGWSAKSYIYEATSVRGLNNLDSFIVKTISPVFLAGSPKFKIE